LQSGGHPQPAAAARRQGARESEPLDDGPRRPGRPAGGSGDQTRERIIQKGLETFAELGFAGSSVRDIARRARIRVSSLYHYFPSKEALYQAVVDRMQGEARELAFSVMSKGLDLRSLTREAVGRLFDFFLAHPAYVRLGCRVRLEGLEGSLPVIGTDRWIGMMEGLMKPAQVQGHLKPVDPALFLVTMDGLVHWHTTGDRFFRALLGKGLDDPEVAQRVREHVVQVTLRTLGLE
jgi:AcrR family transcriptional regulator